MFFLGQAVGILGGIGLGQVLFSDPAQRRRGWQRITRWVRVLWLVLRDLPGDRRQGAPLDARSGTGMCECGELAWFEPRARGAWWRHDDPVIDTNHRVMLEPNTDSYGPAGRTQ